MKRIMGWEMGERNMSESLSPLKQMRNCQQGSSDRELSTGLFRQVEMPDGFVSQKS